MARTTGIYVLAPVTLRERKKKHSQLCVYTFGFNLFQLPSQHVPIICVGRH